MAASPSSLATQLRGLVGHKLRCVALYDGERHEIEYLREDVEPKVHADRIERVHEELVLGAIGNPYLEGLFELGTLRATIHHFDEGLAIHAAGEPYTGVFVSVDSEAADLAPALIDACRTFLGGDSADDQPLVRGTE